MTIESEAITPDLSIKPAVGGILTERQMEILPLLLGGETHRAIGYRLKISKRTVSKHIDGAPGSAANPSKRGIYGNIEKALGERPKNAGDLLRILFRSGLVEIEN